MRNVSVLPSSKILFAGLVSCVVLGITDFGVAAAADWYTGAAPARPSNDWIVAVDASATATSTGSQFASVAATVAPIGNLNTSGPRIRLEGLAGTYKFDAANGVGRVTGEQYGGALLAGYQWTSPRSALSAFGGVDLRDSKFSGVTTGLPQAGLREGFKGVFEYYANPTDQSMLFAYGAYSTIYNAYHARAKLGVVKVAQTYFGPEVAVLGDNFYRQWRIGAHLTGYQLGAFQFGVSAGYLSDKDGRGGAYGALDVRAVY